MIKSKDITIGTYRQFKHEVLARAAANNNKYNNAKMLLPVIKTLLLFQDSAVGIEKAEIDECLNRLVDEVSKMVN